MKIFTLKGLSKQYALRAALYRRTARAQGPATKWDFSETALRDLHLWESTGRGGADKASNGYAYGKWAVDITVKAWVEDIQAGDACKAEYLSTALQRVHNSAKLRNIVVGELFAWRSYSTAELTELVKGKRAHGRRTP
jgi:hypothetical protein